MRAAVVTKDSWVPVRLQADGLRGCSVRLTRPAECMGALPWKEAREPLQPGQHTMDGEYQGVLYDLLHVDGGSEALAAVGAARLPRSWELPPTRAVQCYWRFLSGNASEPLPVLPPRF